VIPFDKSDKDLPDEYVAGDLLWSCRPIDEYLCSDLYLSFALRNMQLDTVTTTYSASLSTSTSHDFSQSIDLMETQTQLNSSAAYSEVQTTDTNLNTNIHQ
jgi:hypothetical protein